MAEQSAAPGPSVRPTRAILEDRYDGLMYQRREPHMASGIQEQLDDILWRLMIGTSRRPLSDEMASAGLVDELEKHIRQRVVAWAMEFPETVR